MPCSKCGKETQGNFTLCYDCNQKKKQDFQPAHEFKPNFDVEKSRLMILSYGKDLVVAHNIHLSNLALFLEAAERYIKTGEFKLVKNVPPKTE